MEIQLEKEKSKSQILETNNQDLQNFDNNHKNKVTPISQLEINNQNITPEKQNEFLQTALGKTINGALDIGLRWILPDLIEDQIIEIKDSLLNNGLKEGIRKSVEVGLDFAKSAYGIISGNFDSISQIQTAVQKGGIIDTISDSLDSVLKYTVKKDIIPEGVARVIRSSKNTILDNIQTNLGKTMTEQLRGIEKIDRYIGNWNQYLKGENFEGMEREYQKIKEQLKILVPLETTLKKARELENLHALIKSNGQDFNISEEEKTLATKLV